MEKAPMSPGYILKILQSIVRRVGCISCYASQTIAHFTVVCLVAKPLNRGDAKVDFVVINSLAAFSYVKSLCYHVN